ncbi:hypothetical protein [Streptomyces sp. H27-H5]|uniref:hypothetical protein n=1 Tax=Streptomyces sp. H27-H5 TaxID=2996460 RepID=UPI00226F7CFE|nr:hypothetical protein [Streptomyces sp. H27-H5]MCY0960844.1 hypothetical protein [Streptomyces sp. H27-H5]
MSTRTLWDIEQVAQYLGIQPHSARGQLSRWSVARVAVTDNPAGRLGALFDADQVRAAAAARPGQGIRPSEAAVTEVVLKMAPLTDTSDPRIREAIGVLVRAGMPIAADDDSATGAQLTGYHVALLADWDEDTVSISWLQEGHPLGLDHPDLPARMDAVCRLFHRAKWHIHPSVFHQLHAARPGTWPQG